MEEQATDKEKGMDNNNNNKIVVADDAASVSSKASSKSTKSSSSASKKKNSLPPAPFSALFRFASTKDIILFAIGIFFCIASAITFPAINLVFGDIVDAIATPVEVLNMVNKSVRAMVLLGVYGFVTFFLSFLFCGFAATNIANGYRTKFLESLLIQDMAFFDNAEPGSLTLMLSDSAMTVQTGLSEKFVQGVQGFFQFIFGFALAFYFGPFLSLVLLACIPVLGGITTAMFMWGSEDGIFGKEAYEKASEIANEAMSNIRTVIALNAETIMSKRYDSKLADSQKAAILQSTRNAFLAGSLFLVIFAMYGLGFWYGAVLIARSTDDAMEKHPPPDNLLDPEGPWYDFIVEACADYLDAAGNALEVCACGLPWELLDDIISPPNCGCGYSSLDDNINAQEYALGVITGNCVSGGRTLMVFFSILIGGFSMGQVGPGVKAAAEAKIAAAKLLSIINREPTIRDQEEENSDGKTKKRLKREDVRGNIVLENLHFRYSTTLKHTSEDDEDGHDASEEVDTTPRVVFGGCNLTITAGETVALVGESGCGKSTIAKLVQRFYDPTDGRVLLDGTDLKDIHVGDLRSNIGVVSQEPLLFDTTIENNIRYGKPNATYDEIVQAAKSANAHDFILTFPDGYQTMVGPKGGKLSGGQKQRVAIARAILRDPPVLVLDEATSALDNKSEKLVQQALDRLIKHEDVEHGEAARSRTIIVIAHRLSTVRNADTIVVLGSPEGTSTTMTGSQVLEQGSHDDLMKLEKGYYKALVGAGNKSTAGLVDDVASSENDEKNVESTPTEEEKPAEENEEKGAADKAGDAGVGEEKKSLWQSLRGENDPNKIKEKKKLKENKAKVWSYTKPEIGWIVFGSMSSIIKGTILPLLSIAFAEMIVVWYNSDTNYITSQSLEFSYVFYGLAIVCLVTETIQKAVFEMVGERLTRRLRGDLFRSILRKDITWFEDDANAVGVLSSRLSTDVKLVRLVAGQSVAATLESCSALTTGIIISAFASWEMFLTMLAMVPALGTAEALQFVAMKGSEGRIRDELSKSTDKLHETVYAIREVQSYSLQQLFIDDIEKRIKETIVPASHKTAILKGIMMGMIQLIQFVVYGFAFWMGGILIEKGRITFDDFMRALWAMAFAASGLGQAALFAGDAAKAAAAVKAVFGTLDCKTPIESQPWENNGIADMKTNEPTVRAIPNTVLKEGKGELSKVNFAYPTRKTAKVYDQIDLQIPAGKVVALVGSSGSGKSTVVQLLLRFYDPISYKEEDLKSQKSGEDAVAVEVLVDDGKLKTADGIVKIDDKDIREEDCRWLRSNMGYVGQEPILFDDTIYNNIALGKENCTQEEVEAAAKNANAFDFITKLDEGFNTMVGLGGGKVSGGQKQRIAIARALVSDPKILILDEATSALDNESEKVVQASLDKLMKESAGRRTTIVIAHRLSTIKGADCICVLENQGDGSRVVEMGTHDELFALGQKYKALVQAYEH